MPSPLRASSGVTAEAGRVGGRLRVLGVQETIRKLQLVGSMAGLKLGHMNMDAAGVMYKAAVQNVPVITGNLKSGIKGPMKVAKYDWIVTASSEAGDDPKGKGKNQYEYAHFVEFGTSKMVGRFYMTAASLNGEAYIRIRLPIIARELERL